jgi:DNA-binding MarR family transcriptional regulator
VKSARIASAICARALELLDKERMSVSDSPARRIPPPSAQLNEMPNHLQNDRTPPSSAIVNHWLPELSGNEFKLLVVLLDRVEGDRPTDPQTRISLAEIAEHMGVDRPTASKGVRDLGTRHLISTARSHRQTTTYSLSLPSLLDPCVETKAVVDGGAVW